MTQILNMSQIHPNLLIFRFNLMERMINTLEHFLINNFTKTFEKKKFLGKNLDFLFAHQQHNLNALGFIYREMYMELHFTYLEMSNA